MYKLQYDGPVVLVVMDGVGLAPIGPGNAVSEAHTKFMAHAVGNYLHRALDASGEAVGLTPGQMGNSEVGHNTIGCGQIYKQSIAHIEDAFATGTIWNSVAWKEIIENLTDKEEDLPIPFDINGPFGRDGKEDEKSEHTLHFSGIFSDGGVHSHISHLEKLIQKAYEEGIRKMRIHAVFDGRDVPPTSEPKFIKEIEEFAKKFKDADIKIASGGGRMTTTADRYENDWDMVKRGWDMMMNGKAENYFSSATEAIEKLRAKNPGIQDQNLPAFVIVDENTQPVGKVEKGDSFIYFDFRADRAIEIARAFTTKEFDHFDRGNYQPEDVCFAGLTEYNTDEHIPERQLIRPVHITGTLNNFLGDNGISQLAVSETVKFGHITYYFNGNSNEKAPKEDFIEISSDTEPFETRPWMKAAEITDAVIKNIHKYRFIRINYPNGDMVGHSADLEATKLAMEALDFQLGRLAKAVDEAGGCMVVTADHGNAEEVLDKNGEQKTSHTLNKVPLFIYDNTENRRYYSLNRELKNPGLSNVAATVAMLLGHEDYPKIWQDSIITLL